MRHVRRHAQHGAARGTKRHMESIRDKVPSITEQQIKELVLKPSILLCLFCIELFTLFPFGSRDID